MLTPLNELVAAGKGHTQLVKVVDLHIETNQGNAFALSLSDGKKYTSGLVVCLGDFPYKLHCVLDVQQIEMVGQVIRLKSATAEEVLTGWKDAPLEMYSDMSDLALHEHDKVVFGTDSAKTSELAMKLFHAHLMHMEPIFPDIAKQSWETLLDHKTHKIAEKKSRKRKASEMSDQPKIDCVWKPPAPEQVKIPECYTAKQLIDMAGFCFGKGIQLNVLSCSGPPKPNTRTPVKFPSVDKDGTMVDVTVWQRDYDKWKNVLVPGKCYVIRDGEMKHDPKWGYSCTLKSVTTASLANNIPVAEPTPLSCMGAKDTVINVMAVIHDVGRVSKTGTAKTKRDVTIRDQSMYETSFTLWGDEAEAFEGKTGQVIQIFYCVVDNYRSRVSLRITGGTKIVLDRHPLKAELKAWYTKNKGARFMTTSEATIPEAKIADLLNRTDPSQVRCTAKFLSFATGEMLPDRKLVLPWYESCDQCYNKFDPEHGCSPGDSSKIRHEDAKMTRRWALKARASDASGAADVTLFGAVAERLIGKTADEAHEIRQRSEEEYLALFGAALGDYTFTANVKHSEYARKITVSRILS